jgi:ribosome-associated toxin RatA of RatAB toxin-antitoxin module|tara:strand:+ start:1875 stop:2294 length:420 start_codon:yes stop_codon:yes gene_type:complete
MTRKISFHKVLNVDSRKTLEVVTNFNDYANFIPGCTSAKLISRESSKEIGRLEFNLLGKDYFIESENIIDDSSIIINQLKGPFKKFKGEWTVESIDESSCQINFNATYELPFLLDAIIPKQLVDNFSKNIIESFIKRVS